MSLAVMWSVVGCVSNRPLAQREEALHAAAPDSGGNVLIVLMDDVGVDRIGLYGAKRPALTPTLDALAADGMLFENAWALPICAPTRAALQTGLLPRRTGYGSNQAVLKPVDVELDPAFTTLAELVDTSPSATYDSSYVGKWHLATVASGSSTLGPKVQGWRWWTGLMSSVMNWVGPDASGGPRSYFHFQRVDDDGNFLATDGYATTVTADDAIGRIETMSEPWLMQVSFNAAHEPFHAPPPELVHRLPGHPTLADLHREMIEAMDTELDRVLDALTPEVRARTTIVVLGDNGTPNDVLEEGEDVDRSKGSLYDGGVHVPFVVSGPFVRRPGERTAAFAHVVDVFPTVADIAGVAPGEVDGVSLLPVLADPAASVRSTLFAEKFLPGGGGPFDIDKRALRNDRFKLVVEVVCDREQLFEYLPGAPDEGPDLLLDGRLLTPEQQEAYTTLHEELEALVGGLVYEGTTWPDTSDGLEPDCSSEDQSG